MKVSRLGEWLADWGLPFGLVVYLALRGGGYDVLVRGEVGLAAWWVVLLGAIAGLLPRRHIGRAAWTVIGLLAAFAAWTTLAAIWSESVERSLDEAARLAAYLGVLVIATVTQGPQARTRALHAVGAAIGVIGALALLSRLHPAWFPTDELAAAQPLGQGRLNYPLNHWGGLAALISMGAPLLVASSVEGRRLITQALSMAAIPALALASFYTYSRVGAAAAIGLGVFFVCYHRRLEALAVCVLGAAGSAVLIVAATQRDALQDGPTSGLAHDQGSEMLAVVVVVCAGVAMLRVGLAVAVRQDLGPRFRFSPIATRRTLTAVLVAAVIAALALGAPGKVEDQWEQFETPGAAVGANRLTSLSGNGRFQYWESALDANARRPLIGIGPGTFEYWWAREGTLPGFIRDAHSLYFETLAELGIIGAALIVTLIGAVLVIGVRRVRDSPTDERGMAAAGVGTIVVFIVGAGVDWLWEISVIPIAFLFVAAALVASPALDEPDIAPIDSRRGTDRLIVGLLSVPALAVLGLSVSGAWLTMFMRDSEPVSGAAELNSVVDDARTAERIQPYAATPYLQEALAREQLGDLPRAAEAARQATDHEQTNWRTWYALARITHDLGLDEEATRSAARALALNPRSPLVADAYLRITGQAPPPAPIVEETQ